MTNSACSSAFASTSTNRSSALHCGPSRHPGWAAFIVFAAKVCSDTGKTIVFKPGALPEEVATNEIEGFRSTPVFEGTRMYVRGLEHLYCIGR